MPTEAVLCLVRWTWLPPLGCICNVEQEWLLPAQPFEDESRHRADDTTEQRRTKRTDHSRHRAGHKIHKFVEQTGHAPIIGSLAFLFLGFKVLPVVLPLLSACSLS
jgi:hypothetical protein